MRRRYLITGASKGIGKEVAILLAQRGCDVILSARDTVQLHRISTLIETRYHVQASVMTVDYSSVESMTGLVEAIYKESNHLDGFISCVGYGQFEAAVDFSYDDISNMFQINTIATMYITNLIAQKMIDQGSGHISLISSIAGKISTTHSSVYSASKFAIIGYANSLRLELLPLGIQITTINPGPVSTSFFDASPTMNAYYQRVQQWALSPEKVAKNIVENTLRNHPRREINLPLWMHALVTLYNMAPSIGDNILTNLLNFKEESP